MEFIGIRSRKFGKIFYEEGASGNDVTYVSFVQVRTVCIIGVQMYIFLYMHVEIRRTCSGVLHLYKMYCTKNRSRKGTDPVLFLFLKYRWLLSNIKKRFFPISGKISFLVLFQEKTVHISAEFQYFFLS